MNSNRSKYFTGCKGILLEETVIGEATERVDVQHSGEDESTTNPNEDTDSDTTTVDENEDSTDETVTQKDEDYNGACIDGEDCIQVGIFL